LALKFIIRFERDKNGKLLSDGALAIYKNNIILPVDGAADGIGGEGSTFYTICLDRTAQLSDDDMLVLNVSIHIFITSNLAFCTTVAGKEGMDKALCHWCKLPSSQ
jgi:hypothetical protein